MTTHAVFVSIDEILRHAHDHGLRCRRMRIDERVEAYAFSGRGLCTVIVLGHGDDALQLVQAGGTEIAVLDGRLAG